MKTTTIGAATPPEIRGAVPFPPALSKAIVAAVVAASFASTYSGVHLGGIQPADLFLLPALFGVAVLVIFGDLRFRIPGWLWAPVLALLLCIMALKYSPIPADFYALRYQDPLFPQGDAVKALFWIIALLGVPIAVLACTALESRAQRRIMASFVAGVAVSSLIALVDLTQLTHIAKSLGYQSNTDRQPGLSEHPNALGLVCVLAAPFAVYFISQQRRRWLPFIALLLLCGGAMVSGSRGSQVAFPAVVLIAFYVSMRSKNRRVGWVLVGIVVLALGTLAVLTQLSPDFLKLFRFEGAAGGLASSDGYRKMLGEQALQDFKVHPIFGIGIAHISEAHNIYLQMISAGGCILFLGMLIYWLGAVRSSWLAMRGGEALGPYLTISVVAWLVIGVMENQLTDRFLYYTVGCAAALAAIRRIETPANRPALASRQASRTGPQPTP